MHCKLILHEEYRTFSLIQVYLTVISSINLSHAINEYNGKLITSFVPKQGSVTHSFTYKHQRGAQQMHFQTKVFPERHSQKRSHGCVLFSHWVNSHPQSYRAEFWDKASLHAFRDISPFIPKYLRNGILRNTVTVERRQCWFHSPTQCTLAKQNWISASFQASSVSVVMPICRRNVIFEWMLWSLSTKCCGVFETFHLWRAKNEVRLSV